jgi:iron complex transport system substrate-binding protein
VIRLSPDVIIYSSLLTSENIERAVLMQERTQIPVVILDADVLRYKEILSFTGELLCKPSKALELIDFITHYVDPVLVRSSAIPAADKKTIYYAEGMRGLNTDPSGSIHSLLIDLLGGINVAQVELLSGKGMTGVSMEQLYTWNPDIILVWSGNFDDMDSYREIKSSKAWQQLDAVKNNRVYQVPWRPFGWIDRPPGINRLIGILWLGNLLYPDLHGLSANLNSITREYFHLFYHYDMSESEATDILNPQPQL